MAKHEIRRDYDSGDPIRATESPQYSPSHDSPGERSKSPSNRKAAIPELCDSRLQKLDLRRWTTVDIDNDVATRCISLYLETDHPLLGHFDPDLFVSDLVSSGDKYCSPLLVNALLYWACVCAIFEH